MMESRRPLSVVFVTERFGALLADENARRCRAMAMAMRDSGHGVAVVTTTGGQCSSWSADYPPGESTYEGLSLERFQLDRSWLSLAGVPDFVGDARTRAALSSGAGEVLRRRLMRGEAIDAVFFTGGFPSDDRTTQHVEVICCPPPTLVTPKDFVPWHGAFRHSRAVGFVSSRQQEIAASSAGSNWECPAIVVGACAEPVVHETARASAMTLVDGPFVLAVTCDPKRARRLVESFTFFRDTHRDTFLEDLHGQRFEAAGLRLVLGGGKGLPHDPASGVLSLGPLDDTTRAILLKRALGYVADDERCELPTGALEAWQHECCVLFHGRGPALPPSARFGSESTYSSPPTFASGLAATLASNAQRRAEARRARAFVQNHHAASLVADALTACVAGATRQSGRQVECGPRSGNPSGEAPGQRI